jgi:hypothetical protein
VAAAGRDGGEEAHDLGAAGDRGELGRHGQDHLLAQHRGQRFDVAALPRAGEPVQDLPLMVIQPRGGVVREWVDAAVGYARGLPPKAAGTRR